MSSAKTLREADALAPFRAIQLAEELADENRPPLIRSIKAPQEVDNAFFSAPGRSNTAVSKVQNGMLVTAT